MKHILILGANGQIARLATDLLLKDSDNLLTLFLRNAKRISSDKNLQTDQVTIVDGDVTDEQKLADSLKGIDIVYANLAGSNIEQQAKTVVKAMDAAHVKRLIWISSIGIYDEVPGKFGEWNNQTLGNYLTTYRAAADVITNSDLDFTIIRPAWLTNHDEVDYKITHKGEAFKGTEVSRLSIAQLVAEIINDPTKYEHDDIGVNKPNTDGDKPAWY